MPKQPWWDLFPNEQDIPTDEEWAEDMSLPLPTDTEDIDYDPRNEDPLT